jgi:hypothetical protein
VLIGIAICVSYRRLFKLSTAFLTAVVAGR